MSVNKHEKSSTTGKSKTGLALKIIVPVVILAGLLTSNYILSDSADSSIPTNVVKRGPVTIKIVESGELRAQDQVTISAANDKQILWLASEGSWVEKGDTLVIYESEKYRISRSEAQSGVLVERSNIIKTQSDLDSESAKEESAIRTYEKMQQLEKDGFAVQSEVEQARLAVIDATSRRRSAEAGIDAAKAKLQQAIRAVKQQERKLNEGVSLAPRAGLVVHAQVGAEEDGKKVEVGMIPFEGMDLMYLPDVSSMRVNTEISEVDLSRVKPGMQAKILLDAWPDAEFKGEVENISDLAKRKISRITGKATGAKVFGVEVKVLGKDKKLKPGLSATCEIIVSEYDDALYIPLEGVFIDELDRTVVYIRSGGAIEKRVVKLGESNERVAVIQEGLAEMDEILLSRPDNL